jgi:hypothetical protein
MAIDTIKMKKYKYIDVKSLKDLASIPKIYVFRGDVLILLHAYTILKIMKIINGTITEHCNIYIAK